MVFRLGLEIYMEVKAYFGKVKAKNVWQEYLYQRETWRWGMPMKE